MEPKKEVEILEPLENTDFDFLKKKMIRVKMHVALVWNIGPYYN